jgi:hypothetical protein
LRQDLFARERRKLVLKLTVTLLVAVAAGGGLTMLATGFDLTAVIILVAITSAMLPFQVKKALKKFTVAYQSLEIELGDTWVTRRGGSLPELTLSPDRVTAIKEIPKKGLFVSTAERFVLLPIPCQIEHYDQIRGQLATWKQIEGDSQLEWYYKPYLVSALTITLAAAAFTPAHRVITLIAAVGLLCFFSFAAYQAHYSPNCPPEAKKASKWIFVLVLAAFVRVWFVWTT